MKSRPWHISWFFILSVTVHAAVLLIWPTQEYNPGSTGYMVHLTMRESAGMENSDDILENNSFSNDVTRHAQAEASGSPTQQSTMPSLDNQTGKPVQANKADMAASQPEDAPATESIDTATQSTLAPRSATPTNHERDRHLRNSIMELITQRLTYPIIARKKGWQGIVRLELHIESDGKISSLHINETSGYAVLDSAAMESLLLASIPHASQWLNGKTINIIIPIEYRLLDT